jgi:hypothetical protein
MCAAVGNHVDALRRVAVGGLYLSAVFSGGRASLEQPWRPATLSDLEAVFQGGPMDLHVVAEQLQSSCSALQREAQVS